MTEQRMTITATATAGGNSVARLIFAAPVPDREALLDFEYGNNGWQVSVNTATIEWENAGIDWRLVGDLILSKLPSRTTYYSYNDFLTYYQVGDAVALGNGAADTLIGTQYNDILFGGAGNDLIDGSVGSDRLLGGDGDDQFLFSAVRSSSQSSAVGLIDGGNGYDVIDATNVRPTYLGSTMFAGVRTLSLTVGSQTFAAQNVERINLGGGNDSFFGFYNLTSRVLVDFGGGNDDVTSSKLMDINMGDGDDRLQISGLFGDSASMTVNGGAGTDLLITNIAFTVDLAAGTASSGGATYSVSGFENVQASLSGYETTIRGDDGDNRFTVGSYGDDGRVGVIFDGRGGNDTLVGSSGADLLIGGDGNDTLYGRDGRDVLRGGSGDDRYVLDGSEDIIEEASDSGYDTISVGTSYALAAGASIERLEAATLSAANALDLSGNEFANTIAGNNGVNFLRGEAGDDVLFGYGGADFLIGGTGSDIMSGGLGNDTFYIDNPGDVVIENAGEGLDRIATSISYSLTSGQSIEVLEAVNSTSLDNLDLTGNAFDNLIAGTAGVNVLRGDDGNDELAGYAGADVLDGGAGNDILIGGIGADMMTGGSGNDKFYVEDRDDVIIEQVNGGFDTVAVSQSYIMADGAEIEVLEPITFGSLEALNITGNAFANRLSGNNGNNILDGGGGNDILEGLGGADIYSFSTQLGPNNIDRIDGFVSGTDRIELSNTIFSAIGSGTLSAGAFVTGSQALDADDRIIFNPTTGMLLYDADGSGSGTAIAFATLASGATLVASDFFIG